MGGKVRVLEQNRSNWRGLRRWDPGLRDEAEAEPGLHLEGSWDSGAEEPMGCFRGVGGAGMVEICGGREEEIVGGK